MTFDTLGLSEKVLAAVQAAGFEKPTPIQEEAIPIAISGRDVLGIAQTGTGKTGAFVLPMLCKLESGRARARIPRSLIIAPTRELAAQVAEAFELLGANHKLTVALLIGGVSFDEQFRKLDRGADVLIATPGRLLDHFSRGKILLNGVEILVIDEADRMLDMGFIPDIERICALLPAKRQTLFFSATMPREIQSLVDRFLRDPHRVEVAPQSSTAKTITQRFCHAPSDDKERRAVLRDLIAEQNIKNAIIFANRKRDVAILLRSLQKHGFNAGALHGDMDQRARMATLDAFRNGDIAILAASDVAARGLDIPEVSHVFNFDVPVNSEDYVHRIGRTGRAGREGYAATLVTEEDAKIFKQIEELVGEEIVWIGDPIPDDAFDNARKRKRGGRKKSSGSDSEASSGRGSGGSGDGANRKSGESDETEDAGRSRQRGGRRSQPEREASVQGPEETGSPAARAERRDRGGGRRRNGRDGRDDVPFSATDDVPAFLLIPIPASVTKPREEPAEAVAGPDDPDQTTSAPSQEPEAADAAAEPTTVVPAATAQAEPDAVCGGETATDQQDDTPQARTHGASDGGDDDAALAAPDQAEAQSATKPQAELAEVSDATATTKSDAITPDAHVGAHGDPAAAPSPQSDGAPSDATQTDDMAASAADDTTNAVPGEEAEPPAIAAQ